MDKTAGHDEGKRSDYPAVVRAREEGHAVAKE